MIARFHVHLPFTMHLPVSLAESSAVHELEISGMKVVFYPPYRSQLRSEDLSVDTAPAWNEIVPRVLPAVPQPIEPATTIDGEAAIRCDALRLDFMKDNFDRSRESEDPPTSLAFQLVNDWLLRLRLLAQAPQVRAVEALECIWRLEYLTDDEAEFEEEPGLARRRLGNSSTFQTVAIADDLWQAVGALPWGYQVPAAETLLLDAYDALREVGPSLVLAWTAIETRISQALDQLAQMYGVSPKVWAWLNDRGFFLKNPSIEEQFDSLMFAITGRTLKENNQLWSEFKALNRARNRFAHTGNPSTQTEIVDWQRTHQLLSAARQVIDWVEALLPEAARRPAFVSSAQVQTILPIWTPVQAANDDALGA